MLRLNSRLRSAFTLVELFAVLFILSVFVGLLLPAVQQARETSRRTQCSNRLRQQSLGLLAFESSLNRLPAGAEPHTFHSWATRILPFLEQENLYQQINFANRWNSSDNLSAVQTNLAVYSCPSSWKDYPGSTDYSGVRGSSHNAILNLGKNGTLFPVASPQQAVQLTEIRDGTSHTLVIAEAVAIAEDSHGYWASGLNCIGHDDGPINNLAGSRDEIASLHPGGANVAFADGSTRFLGQSLSLRIVGAFCTRSNGEVVGDD